eukprot:TRINITY_DN54205_c0_g1_i1.p1 TRINITY_DN54205_c0_g1~~TRINITY_DN54205_c0_g1_i1.p1  ORF type:complete len:197 (-),score=27.57 TRINITY_DN54205_c0_g1_i1:423-1013(-)
MSTARGHGIHAVRLLRRPVPGVGSTETSEREPGQAVRPTPRVDEGERTPAFGSEDEHGQNTGDRGFVDVGSGTGSASTTEHKELSDEDAPQQILQREMDSASSAANPKASQSIFEAFSTNAPEELASWFAQNPDDDHWQGDDEDESDFSEDEECGPDGLPIIRRCETDILPEPHEFALPPRTRQRWSTLPARRRGQ